MVVSFPASLTASVMLLVFCFVSTVVVATPLVKETDGKLFMTRVAEALAPEYLTVMVVGLAETLTVAPLRFAKSAFG